MILRGPGVAVGVGFGVTVGVGIGVSVGNGVAVGAGVGGSVSINVAVAVGVTATADEGSSSSSLLHAARTRSAAIANKGRAIFITRTVGLPRQPQPPQRHDVALDFLRAVAEGAARAHQRVDADEAVHRRIIGAVGRHERCIADDATKAAP